MDSTRELIDAMDRLNASMSAASGATDERVNAQLSSEEISEANSRVGELRDEIRDLQAELSGLDETSAEHLEVMEALAEAEAEYNKEVKNTTAALSDKKKAMATLKKAIVGVSSEINGVQDLSRELQRTGAASKEVARMASRMGDSLRVAGVDYEETAAAAEALVSGVSDFTMMSATMQKSVMKDAALFAELGVSNDQYAKGLQLGIKSMGLSTEKAASQMKALRSTALAMQVPVGELTDDYIAQENKIAELGATGFATFQEMARIQKVTGLEMGKLIAMTDKFDTFEGAAEAAGSLNAALGGNFVDSMSLMMEDDPAERFKMIRDAIEDAGVSVEDMGRKQQMFLANAANFDNVADFKKAMSGDLSALTKESEGAGVDPAMQDLETSARNIRSQTELAANMAKAVAPAYGTLAAKAEEFVDKHAPALTAAADKVNQMNIKATEALSDGAAATLGAVEGGMSWYDKAMELLGIFTSLKILVWGEKAKKMFVGLKNVVVGFMKWILKLPGPLTRIPNIFGDMFKGADKLANVLGSKLPGKLGFLVKKIPVIGGIVSGLMNAWDSLTQAFASFTDGNYA